MSSAKPKRNVRAYIDGFNLYHAIDDLNDDYLKWVNLHKLMETFVEEGEILEKTFYFTSILHWNPQKQQRHKVYIAALRAAGVVVHEATFKRGGKHCHRFQRTCPFYEEKQTDVAIAVSILADAYAGAFHRAILVTADTDQIPMVRHFKQQFPDKKMSLVTPPERLGQARELGNLLPDRYELKAGRIATCRLPRDVFDAMGKKVATMPAKYKH